jgi:hypothetical protein
MPSPYPKPRKGSVTSGFYLLLLSIYLSFHFYISFYDLGSILGPVTKNHRERVKMYANKHEYKNFFLTMIIKALNITASPYFYLVLRNNFQGLRMKLNVKHLPSMLKVLDKINSTRKKILKK